MHVLSAYKTLLITKTVTGREAFQKLYFTVCCFWKTRRPSWYSCRACHIFINANSEHVADLHSCGKVCHSLYTFAKLRIILFKFFCRYSELNWVLNLSVFSAKATVKHFSFNTNCFACYMKKTPSHFKMWLWYSGGTTPSTMMTFQYLFTSLIMKVWLATNLRSPHCWLSLFIAGYYGLQLSLWMQVHC